MLLNRNDFHSAVLNRDDYKCVICHSSRQVVAHHIMERRLWDDEGYYLDNGVTLCESDHMLAEETLLTCDELRRAVGIDNIHLPPHLYDDSCYDKWGNIILSSGNRVPGELFHDLSVQKILRRGGVLHLFITRIRYPRTYHLPWSPGITRDDRVLSDITHFEGHRVVVTEKCDGENTSLYRDYMHARSISSSSHPSQSWIKSMHAKMAFNIPDGWRICGENLFAKHSIQYLNLPSYFLVFSIWNENNICLSWDETLEWTELLGLYTVPVLYVGIWDEHIIRALYDSDKDEQFEGYVVRFADSFPYSMFRRRVAKFVRKDHVKTTHNWRFQRIVKNELSNRA